MNDRQDKPGTEAASGEDRDAEVRYWEAVARDDRAAFSALVEPLLADLEELK